MPKLKYFAGMEMMNDMMDMNGNMIEMDGMKMQNQEMDMNTVMYPEISGPENSEDTIQTESGHDKGVEGNGKEMQMAGDSHGVADMVGDDADIMTLNYGMLRSPQKTTLPEGPLRELHFDLTGNMNRYIWTMDNKTISESDKISIKRGENVRIVLFNNSMMRHPIHLHGHDFRVLNGQGDHAPLKNVLDIMPMETDTIEFAATESGDWFFHCHILYHMMSGMGRIFSYEDSPVNPDLPDPKNALQQLFADDREFHPMARIGIESNGSDGEAMIANTRWKLETMWHLGYHDMHGYESETMLGRYIDRMQWWFPYVGFDYHYKKVESQETNWFGQLSNKNNRKALVGGVQYTLPMLVLADSRIDTDGKLRFQLSREDVSVTSRLRLAFMVNTDAEYMIGFRYISSKYFSVSSHYDSDMGLGAGIIVSY